MSPRKHHRPKGIDVAIVAVVLVLKDREPDTLQKAYRDLRYSDIVRRYFKRFEHHGPCQACVMTGRVMFEGPDIIVKQVQTDLTGGDAPAWTQGTGEDLSVEREALAARRARRQRDLAGVRGTT